MSTTNLATAKQVGMIKGLLTQLRLIDDSAGYAKQYSNNRTEHIGELTMPEANQLIKNLMPTAKAGQPNEHTAKAEACNTMRRKIISMAREMGWNQHNHATGKLQANMERIEGWCIHHGYLAKGLNKYSFDELPKLVTQMEYVLADFRGKL
jgi:hypothetical protein